MPRPTTAGARRCLLRAHACLLTGLLSIALTACAPRLPPTGEAARAQVSPATAAPLAEAWPGAAATLPGLWKGRLIIETPGGRRSLGAMVKLSANAAPRVVLIADGGVLLADLSLATTGRPAVTHRLNELLTEHEALLRRLVTAWCRSGPPPPGAAGTWDDEVLILAAPPAAATADGSTAVGPATTAGSLHFAGDPVLLRAWSGDGWTVSLDDYRLDGTALRARAATAHGPFGVRVSLMLSPESPAPAPAPSSAPPG